jgi:putative spermidine/putrescine transport system permease protein
MPVRSAESLVPASSPSAGMGDRAERARRRVVLGQLALGTPAMLLLLAIAGVPLAQLFATSFEGGGEWYVKALSEALYLRVFAQTFWIALLVTGSALLLAYPVAYLLATTSRFWQIVGFGFVMLPFWTSILVRTYAWMVLLGRSGVINKTLIGIGVIDRPLSLLHNTTGVVIGMTHVLLPYMILPIFAAMRRVDPDLLRAAQGLGAPGYRVFLRIYLPLTMHGVLAGVMIVFVLSLGFFITPALLGGGRVIMIGPLIEQQVREFLNWGFAGALSVILLVATLVVYGIVHRLLAPKVATQ